MTTTVTFRHMDGSNALRDYASEKVQRIAKLLPMPTDAHVTLEVQKHLHHAEVRLSSGDLQARGSDSSDDMYKSIDNALDKIERQIVRYKKKLADKKSRGGPGLKAATFQHSVVEGEPLERSDGETVISKRKTLAMQAMSIDEAIMQMNLLNNEFFVFVNSMTKCVNVVYRRPDGNYGLIETAAKLPD